MPVRFRILSATAAGLGASSPGAGPRVERLVEIAGALDEIRLGRRADLELPLPFAALSGVHARVLRTPEGWHVEDAGSTNGTWLEGERVAPGERRVLVPGAELLLGNVRLRFEGEGSSSPSAAAEGTATIARRLVDDLFAASPAKAPALRVLRGAPVQRLALGETGRAYFAGRAEACALSLDVEEVSREHATFTRAATGIVVRDLGSKNGVVIAGARIVGERVVSDGDVVEIGPVAVTLDDPVGRYLRELEAEPAPVAAPAPVVEPGLVDVPALVAEEAVLEIPAQRRSSTQLALVIGGAVLLLLGAAAVLLVVSSR
jgi:pSer/pThr/pTyr-binding forkhead associated (FHA) protein